MKINLFLIIFSFYASNLSSQQIADTLYTPILNTKTYIENSGTLVYIDQGHNNFHTKDNRYLPFARLLHMDGYQVKAYDGEFEKDKLKDLKILVISNALSKNARPPFVTPTQSAFTKNEIECIETWVKNGGSLFLIADHMPFAGASANLAKKFGFVFYDGFVFNEKDESIFDFSIADKTLTQSRITQGRNTDESINKIRTFTGQAFRIPKEATSILNLKKEYNVFLTDTMWVFNDKTPEFSAKDLSQGAFLKYGKGRIVVFGEAAMFTAQIAGRERIKVGMNAIEAPENYQLLLNTIHWLDGLY